MKMLSDLHVIIKLRINHPTFGYLEVDQFQRIPSEITDRITYQSMIIPVVEKSEVLKIKNYCPVMYVTVPHDFVWCNNVCNRYKRNPI